MVARFVTDFNAGRLNDAAALFTDDASVSDCDYTTQTAILARGRTAIRAWLERRFADHDRLIVARIFNMNPDSDRAVGVEFAARSSDTIARLGARDGIVPETVGTIVFDTSGQRILGFVNGPGDLTVALRVCSVPDASPAPAATPPA